MTEKVDFDKYADEYEKTLTEDLAFFGEESGYFADYKIKIVREKLQYNPAKILDFGCGIGRNLEFFKKYFPDSEIFACDISAKSIEIAKKKNPDVTFFLITEENVAGYSKAFDLIFTSCVFHHIEPPKRKESSSYIFNMLNDGGHFFNFEHNPYNPVTLKIVKDCVWDADAILLQPKETMGLATASGLEVREKKYTLFFPAFLKFLRFFEKIIWWLPMGGQYYVIAKKN